MAPRFLAALVSLLVFTQPAQAQQLARQTLAYEASYRPEARNFLAPSMVPLKFDGQFAIWYLLGEPVVNCTGRWLNSDQLSVKTPGGDTIVAQAGDAEAYNLMLVAQAGAPDADSRPMGERGGHVAAFCDAGVVAQNGDDGFNVAGSPNWDRFLCRLNAKFRIVDGGDGRVDREAEDDCQAIGGSWYSAEEAKGLIRGGLTFEDVRVKSVEVNAGEAIKRHEKALWRDTSFAHKAAKATALGERMGPASPGGAAAAQMVSAMRIKKGGQAPSPSLLQDFDHQLADLQAELQDPAAFAADWRPKDEALVRGQLARVRAIEPALLAAEDRLARYRVRLEREAKDAPRAAPDAMEKYLTRDLEVFGDHSVCGFRRPGGRVVVGPPTTGNSGCPQEEGRFGLYPRLVSRGPNGESLPSYHSSLSVYDNDGRAIISNMIIRADWSEGLYITPIVSQKNELYLDIQGRNLSFLYYIVLSKIIIPASNGYIHDRPVIRNGREAIVHQVADDSCPWTGASDLYSRGYIFRYFYTDTNRVEDDSCIRPGKDPDNTKRN